MKKQNALLALAIAAVGAVTPMTRASAVQDPAWEFLYAFNGQRVYLHTSYFVDEGDSVLLKTMTAYPTAQSLVNDLPDLVGIDFNSLTLDDITEDTLYNYRSTILRADCNARLYAVEEVVFFLENMVMARGTSEGDGFIPLIEGQPSEFVLNELCNPVFDED